MARFHVIVHAVDAEAHVGLIHDPEVPVVRDATPGGDTGYAVISYLSEEQIRVLEAAGYTVELREDVDAGKAERLADVGGGNRYAERLALRRRSSGR